MSRPYDCTRHFQETAHFQTIESDDEPDSWLSLHYYNDEEISQKINPGRFYSDSYFNTFQLKKLIQMIALIRFKDRGDRLARIFW